MEEKFKDRPSRVFCTELRENPGRGGRRGRWNSSKAGMANENRVNNAMINTNGTREGIKGCLPANGAPTSRPVFNSNVKCNYAN